MPRSSVTDCLDRARAMADLADKKTGAEKRRLMQLAQAWLKLADDNAVEAMKSAKVSSELPEHPEAH